MRGRPRASTERRRRRCRRAPPARPSGRARRRRGRSGRRTRPAAASGRRAARCRAPCPSRCGGRRPRGRRSASPSSVKRPVAWRPPVRSKASCSARIAAGAARTTSRSIAGLGARGRLASGRTALTCSSAALPQTPHDEVRWNERSALGSRRRPAFVRASTTFAARSSDGADRGQVVRARDQSLAGQEARRQLLVLARRAHRHRERDAVDADLERLLDGEIVARVLRGRSRSRARWRHAPRGARRLRAWRHGARGVRRIRPTPELKSPRHVPPARSHSPWSPACRCCRRRAGRRRDPRGGQRAAAGPERVRHAPRASPPAAARRT